VRFYLFNVIPTLWTGHDWCSRGSRHLKWQIMHFGFINIIQWELHIDIKTDESRARDWWEQSKGLIRNDEKLLKSSWVKLGPSHPFSSPKAALLRVTTTNCDLRSDPIFCHVQIVRFIFSAIQICQLLKGSKQIQDFQCWLVWFLVPSKRSVAFGRRML